ncbi:GGDEF domain-containing protein [Parahaliea maris]|uniref:diguanylate cyclase n=1 Tax=Parahaliea maris TaxID=2716870 RepID=A0A5C8ZSN5_9GAMM|nr:GGDEF domain-containing protein [Parahaliea maris]TXS90769.1 GGDEF domain-containing protein [Parahaliea maris]
MPSFLRLHTAKLLALLLVANSLLLLYLGAGEWKPTEQWSWADIAGEGGAAVLVFVWLCLILNSRPAGRITTLLSLGLGLMFVAWWVDALDEFIQLPEGINWDHWLESLPMASGLLLLTYGLFHWHHEQLAISGQLQKRERLLREHRYFDHLTPLSGADYLRQQIAQCQQAQQGATPVSLVALDLDGFDSINQRFGHREGDAVLQAVSQLILLNLRNQDLLCRLAGDRFVALLPGTGETQAGQLARDLADALRHFAYHTQQHGERLQLNATTAVVMAMNESPEDLLQRLQLALCRARQPLALQA